MSVLNRVTTPKIPLGPLGKGFARADIEFDGVDHSGSTYEGRVFVNKPDADARTATTPANGYAGSYYVFGHGGCYGDEGHCDVVVRGPYDPRPPHELSPTRKVVIATDAISGAVKGGRSLTVTVVPVVMSTTDKVSADEVVPSFTSVSVITYQ